MSVGVRTNDPDPPHQLRGPLRPIRGARSCPLVSPGSLGVSLMNNHITDPIIRAYLNTPMGLGFDYNAVARLILKTSDALDDDAANDDVPYHVFDAREACLLMAREAFGDLRLEVVHRWLSEFWS